MQVQKRIETEDPPRDVPCGKVFDTTFIKDCFNFIIGAPIKFMERGEPPQVTADKFGTIASTLLGVFEPGVPPGTVPADPVAAALTAFLVARPWPPAGGSVGPVGFETLRSRTVQLVELAEIMEKLLQRVCEGHGGSGGSSDWPPHVRP